MTQDQTKEQINIERKQVLQRANFWTIVVDLLLSIGKTLAGFLFHSQALIVDGIHSFSDLVTDVFVVWITKLSHAEPDEDHPYGHARFETVGTVVFGLFLITVAFGFAYKGVVGLMEVSSLSMPTWPALVVAVIAVFAKEALYLYSKRIGEKYKSQLLLANAWHHRSDVLSTIVVIIGIAGAMSGVVWLDAFAALIVALMIAWVGAKLMWENISELVDTSPFAGDINKLREVISKVDGVEGVHEIRSRKMGPHSLLDAHIQVPSYVSVSEGHQIGDWVSLALHQNFADISEVIVHIDAEDDLETEKSELLPLRNQVLEELKDQWKGLPHKTEIKDIVLHYLKGKIHVDVMLPISLLQKSSAEEIENEFNLECEQLSWLGALRIMYISKETSQKLELPIKF